MAAYCKFCDAEITFDDEHVSERTGKKIPLDPETDKPHDCRIWELKNRKYFDCHRGCGSQIYFDKKQRTESGRRIPIDKNTTQPHECEGEGEGAQQGYE